MTFDELVEGKRLLAEATPELWACEGRIVSDFSGDTLIAACEIRDDAAAMTWLHNHAAELMRYAEAASALNVLGAYIAHRGMMPLPQSSYQGMKEWTARDREIWSTLVETYNDWKGDV